MYINSEIAEYLLKKNIYCKVNKYIREVKKYVCIKKSEITMLTKT